MSELWFEPDQVTQKACMSLFNFVSLGTSVSFVEMLQHRSDKTNNLFTLYAKALCVNEGFLSRYFSQTTVMCSSTYLHWCVVSRYVKQVSYQLVNFFKGANTELQSFIHRNHYRYFSTTKYTTANVVVITIVVGMTTAQIAKQERSVASGPSIASTIKLSQSMSELWLQIPLSSIIESLCSCCWSLLRLLLSLGNSET